MRPADASFGASPAERLAVFLVLAATVILLAAWPAWWAQEGGSGGYEAAPDTFQATVENFARAHATGREAEGRPVVAPPPGDVPLLARRFEFWPALELEVGRPYRLHVASTDGVHILALDGREMLLVPGRVEVLNLTPAAPGRLSLRCGEYCGLGHNRMAGTIEVR